MNTNIAFICVAYICIMNACIGLYVGLHGFDGFVRPRPVASLILLICGVAPPLVLYAQKKYNFKAEPKDIMATLVFFAIAYTAGRIFRNR